MDDRELWMDVLRGEAVLLIIVFHSTGLLRHAEVEAPPAAVAFNDLSEPHWMPVFSFLSGMLVDSSMGKGAPDYYLGKSRTGLYPFAIWTAIDAVVSKPPLTGKTVLRLATGGSYLFFLAFLFGFNALSYPLRDVPPEIAATTSLAVGAVAPRMLPGVPDRFTGRFWYLLAMFMLGRRASRSPQLWRRLQASRTMLAASIAALSAGSLTTLRGRRVSYRWEWAWSPALAMVAFARAASAIEDLHASRPLRFIGENSIVYYTVHYPVAYGAARWCRARGVRSGWRALATTLAASGAVSTALALARRRSPTIEKLFSI